MIPFGFAKRTIESVVEFEEALVRIADVTGVPRNELAEQALALSRVSMLSPLAALRDLAAAIFGKEEE